MSRQDRAGNLGIMFLPFLVHFYCCCYFYLSMIKCKKSYELEKKKVAQNQPKKGEKREYYFPRVPLSVCGGL